MKLFNTTGLKFKINHPAVEIHIDHDLVEKTKYLVSKAPKECQWFYEVTRYHIEDKNVVVYALENMWMPEQVVSGASVDSEPDAMIKLYKEITESCGGDHDKANEVIERLTGWCHSHVDMPPNPSSVDEDNFKEMREMSMEDKSESPIVMLIFNKRGEYYSRVFDPMILGGGVYENVPMFEIGNNYPEVDEMLKTKVKEKVYTSSKGYQNYYDKDKKGGHSSMLPVKTGKGKGQLDPIDFTGVTSFLVQEALRKEPTSKVAVALLSMLERLDQLPSKDVTNIDTTIKSLITVTEKTVHKSGIIIMSCLLFGSVADSKDLCKLKFNELDKGKLHEEAVEQLRMGLSDLVPTGAEYLMAMRTAHEYRFAETLVKRQNLVTRFSEETAIYDFFTESTETLPREAGA